MTALQNVILSGTDFAFPEGQIPSNNDHNLENPVSSLADIQANGLFLLRFPEIPVYDVRARIPR